MSDILKKTLLLIIALGFFAFLLVAGVTLFITGIIIACGMCLYIKIKHILRNEKCTKNSNDDQFIVDVDYEIIKEDKDKG